MMSPGQSKKETRESAAAKEKAKANMYLTGGQAKLDKNKNNKIDAQDFKILRAEKAKGRGQGLQDEKVKPGKVMKAKRGSGIKLPKEGSRLIFSGYSKPFEGPQHKGRVAAIVGVKPRAQIIGQRKKFKSLEEMRKAKGFKMIGGKQETSEQFNRRKAKEAFAKRAAKATGARGKIALGVAAAGVGAYNYLKSKMKKEQVEPKKKMGGGMMKKYNKGNEVRTFTDPKTAMIAHSLKTKDKIGENERRTAKFLEKRGAPGIIEDGKIRRNKKMGGGMMKKPMGYDRGGMYLSDEKVKKVFPEKDAKRRAIISQLVGGDRVSPMKKERFTAGQSARRRGLLKKLSKQAAKATPLGLGIKVGEVAKKIKEKVKSRSEGGPMARAMGRGKKLTASDMRDAQLKEKKYDKFFAGQKSEFLKKMRAAQKLDEQMKKVSPIASSRLYEKGTKEIFGKQAYQDNMKASFRDTAKTLMGGGMMNKPMGYKSGTSVKVKCKLGRNKPTKMY